MTCSGRCRQKKLRRDRDVVRLTPPRDPRGYGERQRTAVERLERIVERYAPHGAVDTLEFALRHNDVIAAIEAPGAPLEDWDERLTRTIRHLSSLRRAIRDAPIPQ